MSAYYEHFLIPSVPDYRPAASAIAAFLRGVIDHGHVGCDPTITYAKVSKDDSRVFHIRDFVTGEPVTIRAPSRKMEKREQLTALAENVRVAENEGEYNVWLASEGIPQRPSFVLGYVDDGKWKAFEGPPYHAEVWCQVRSRIVRLYHLESEDDLHRPPDLSNSLPRFDEDCGADQRDGLFVHPEVGAIRISNAGCGMFWITFRFGKFVFPRIKEDQSVNLLDESIVDLARGTFGVDFVQACDWG
jgi:hypothetical protein